MQQFTKLLLDDKVLTSGIKIDKTYFDIGSVTNYGKGFDVLRGLKAEDINQAIWVGLDTRTEKKLAEVEADKNYAHIRYLGILEKKRIPKF